jgi:GNAT superfamily N-acetyltransferase
VTAVPPAGASVRPADLLDAGDVRSLAALRWEWRIDRGEVPPNPQAAFEQDFAAWCAAHVEGHRAFLATDPEGAVVGMAWFGSYERVPGPEHWTRRSGAVQSVYVTPSARGSGLGAALIEAVLDGAAGDGIDHLLLHPTEESVPLYQRHGFAVRDRAMEIDLRTRPTFRKPVA